MNRTEDHGKRGGRIGVIGVVVLIVVARSADLAMWERTDKLVITGPTRILNAKLAGFDLGFNLFALPALFGEQTGGKETAPGASGQTTFGGGYSSLTPQQKRLVDDWFQRFSSVVKKAVDPGEGYEEIPLSAKTTFNAVTHALMKTGLTDESGKKLAESALDLVDKVDTIAGQILGAGGDEQFRIYVQMKPDALRLLNQSREFKHASDNTTYHKGYPICYRTRGTPSIQISLTRDAERADIDVDYRSSGFTGLLNGHLSASNSDVRAGDNDARHNKQWSGLQNWWRNLLGLPLLEDVSVEGQVIARESRHKGAKPADAIFDFLNSWLVEQKPYESIAYFANEAYACMSPEEGKKRDLGMAKFMVLHNMQSVNERIGRISSLREASAGFALTGTRVKAIKQAHSPEFVMYDVREDLAEEFKCANRTESADISVKEMKSRAFGKYVAAVFRISAAGEQGRTIATLWRRNHDYWNMVSYEVDPELDRNSVPNASTAPVKVTSLPVVDGDKDMIRAASDFLKLWLVKKDVDSALRYLTPECLECARLYRSDDSPPSSTATDLLRDVMTRTAATIGPVNHLDEAIVAAQPYHQDMKLVKHRDDKAFVIASIPEYMGDTAKCDRRDADGDPVFSSALATGYGKYYASGFSLNEGKNNPAVLWIVWTRVNGSWKALAYVLLTR
jgi:hypothetical protein